MTYTKNMFAIVVFLMSGARLFGMTDSSNQELIKKFKEAVGREDVSVADVGRFRNAANDAFKDLGEKLERFAEKITTRKGFLEEKKKSSALTKAQLQEEKNYIITLKEVSSLLYSLNAKKKIILNFKRGITAYNNIFISVANESKKISKKSKNKSTSKNSTHKQVAPIPFTLASTPTLKRREETVFSKYSKAIPKKILKLTKDEPKSKNDFQEKVSLHFSELASTQVFQRTKEGFFSKCFDVFGCCYKPLVRRLLRNCYGSKDSHFE